MSVSDATGVTAKRVIKAALLQFEDIAPSYQRHLYGEHAAQSDDILRQAGYAEGVILYSPVSRRLRAYLLSCRKR